VTGTGEQRRDMLHVDDAVDANIFAMNHKKNFGGKAFDTGTGENISLNEVKEIVEKYFPKVNFEYTSPRPNEVMITKANPTPLATLGWKHKIGVPEGISNCFRELSLEI